MPFALPVGALIAVHLPMLVVFHQPFDCFHTLRLGEMFPDGNCKLPILPPPVQPHGQSPASVSPPSANGNRASR